MEPLMDYVSQNETRYLKELKQFLQIPSISSLPEHNSDIRRAAQWLVDHLSQIGLRNVRMFETPGHPVVYADWTGDTNAPTVLIYGHYDVQPVDPIELWTSPPFEPTIRDGEFYARGATDDKGQLFTHIKSVEAYLKVRGKLPVNVKFIFEGEEEIGSINLTEFLRNYKAMLQCDLVLVSDTAMYARKVPSICTALRGLSYMQIEVTGPNKDLHSGSFGGSVHNPLQALAEIIAGLHDKNGKITIKDFYKDVRAVSGKERKLIAQLPQSDRKFAKELGVKQLYGEKGFSTLERIWIRPTLEVNGMWGGFTGDGEKTVLPSKAFAKISMRLVPDQDPDTIAKLFERHIKSIAPKTVSVNVKYLHGGKPALTEIETNGVRAAYQALRKAWLKKPVFMREGGSIPIVVDFEEILGASTVLLGFGLPDENAHAPDERLNLENFFKGIETSVFFFDEYAALHS